MHSTRLIGVARARQADSSRSPRSAGIRSVANFKTYHHLTFPRPHPTSPPPEKKFDMSLPSRGVCGAVSDLCMAIVHRDLAEATRFVFFVVVVVQLFVKISPFVRHLKHSCSNPLSGSQKTRCGLLPPRRGDHDGGRRFCQSHLRPTWP